MFVKRFPSECVSLFSMLTFVVLSASTICWISGVLMMWRSTILTWAMDVLEEVEVFQIRFLCSEFYYVDCVSDVVSVPIAFPMLYACFRCCKYADCVSDTVCRLRFRVPPCQYYSWCQWLNDNVIQLFLSSPGKFIVTYLFKNRMWMEKWSLFFFWKSGKVESSTSGKVQIFSKIQLLDYYIRNLFYYYFEDPSGVWVCDWHDLWNPFFFDSKWLVFT